ncbi:MAG: glycosyltransferase family 2 protein [Desulfobacterales bacterium]|nr:glycosyltransferase family 2 protein [Desulfobacterales bacterium]
MITTTPKILIIVVTWNKREFVLRLLDSINHINYPKESLDILVVDNASDDKTTESIRQAYPHIICIQNSTNLGGSGGFNTGLSWAFDQKEGQYTYIWLLDNDVVVHRNALIELVQLLEAKKDAAIAGSTMMQLDYPWRINEIGAFINQANGNLILNRHLEEVITWKGLSITQLLEADFKLSSYISFCPSHLDVDYVAAASLLVRADVAKKAGLWKDFFIHFDDVEWCQRIAMMGYRILVSTQSLIWHLSAVTKVPTWILYYDNRNRLYLLKEKGLSPEQIKPTYQYILKKALYYTLLGKTELAQLHIMAIKDYQQGYLGHKSIALSFQTQPNSQILTILDNPSIRSVLIPWTINLSAMKIQEAIAQLLLKRKDLHITFLTCPGGFPLYQLPKSNFIYVPMNRFQRWQLYWKLRGRFDLVFQSDYQPILGLSHLKSKILFINDENFALFNTPKSQDIYNCVRQILNLWNSSN